ncbi:MAG: hypothetical protein ACREGK_00270, partial [Geminicoccales bacterium]
SALLAHFDGRGSLTTVEGSVSDDPSAAALAQAVRELPRPPVAVIVSVMGPIERGRLLDQPADFLGRKLRQDVAVHLHAARHLLPELAAIGRPSRYLVIGGPCGDAPWSSYGHLSVAAAALRMLVQVLRAETNGAPVRVQQLYVESPVRTIRNRTCACPEWPDALSVGRRAVDLLEESESTETIVRYRPVSIHAFARRPVAVQGHSARIRSE